MIVSTHRRLLLNWLHEATYRTFAILPGAREGLPGRWGVYLSAKEPMLLRRLDGNINMAIRDTLVLWLSYCCKLDSINERNKLMMELWGDNDGS